MTSAAFDDAFQQIGDLVSAFRANESYFLSPGYQEAEVRKDFIDKFFMVLGWDVNHERQPNPYEQEVKVERGVAVGLGKRRADYAFHIAPNFRDPKFLVEAKKPSRDLANADDYFQAIRYGWNKNNPLAALTDFEELHVLDCRFEPDIRAALDRELKKYHYLEYANRETFAEIYWLLSREAVVGGSLEKFAESLPKPRGKAKARVPAGRFLAVDESFLAELDQYRQTLAKAFKKENPDLDSETLTEITQRTLDRLVFMRFFEDKLIVPAHFVDKFGQRETPWQDFVAASRRLDGIYNGVVFKRHSVLDRDDFTVDEDSFADICRQLSHEHSPYDFNSIPIHILGSIYERFLGNVIVATDKRVRVEQKPEVRKAGGVYYTPDYIVQYIVANTVGTLIEGKTPAEIAELRFADIACGSGSFLLGVYDLLLRYHAKWYNEHPSKAKKADCVSRDGVLALSLEKKRQILLNNIYGVDIDPQAVEVTQLSLYLKLLEEETIASTHGFQLEMHTTILPSLDKNVVCGNSLIGRDILSGQLFTTDEEKKLNPMDFKDAFSEVMRRGGFDAVVGNPPYIRIQTMQEWTPRSVEYFKQRYKAARKGNYDIYVVLVERGLSLLNKHGHLGFILPHKFFNSEYGEPLREVLTLGKHLSHIVHFGAEQVFAGATTYTCLLFLEKAPCRRCRFHSVSNLQTWIEKGASVRGDIVAEKINGIAWNITVGPGADLAERLAEMSVRFGDAADIFVGLQTSADDVFILETVAETSRTIRLYSKALESEVALERNLLHPLVSGTDVQGYNALPRRQFILFPYEVAAEAARLISFINLTEHFPKTAAYLLKNRRRLESRERGRFNDVKWHRFGRSQNLGIQGRPKICVPRLVDRLCATIDPIGEHYLDNVDVGGVTIGSSYDSHDLRYVL